jgi:hypothetical protein
MNIGAAGCFARDARGEGRGEGCGGGSGVTRKSRFRRYVSSLRIMKGVPQESYFAERTEVPHAERAQKQPYAHRAKVAQGGSLLQLLFAITQPIEVRCILMHEMHAVVRLAVLVSHSVTEHTS